MSADEALNRLKTADTRVFWHRDSPRASDVSFLRGLRGFVASAILQEGFYAAGEILVDSVSTVFPGWVKSECHCSRGQLFADASDARFQ